MRAILWFRGKDLRVHDHAALAEACARASELLPVFVLSPRYFSADAASAESFPPHRVQYLLAALRELAASIEALGSRLFIVAGPAERTLPDLASQLKVDEVIALASGEPAARKRDARVAERLRVPLLLRPGETLAPPGTLRTRGGGLFQVFTPFARAFRTEVHVAEPLPAPSQLPPLPELARNVTTRAIPTLAELGVRENPSLLVPGERAARERLEVFLKRRAARYDEDRDRLDLDGTSRLSADLRFGTLSVRTAYHVATQRLERTAPDACSRFQDELLWRELAYHWLAERPQLLREPFRREFAGFPWSESAIAWRAWANGQTGYPIVDAAARELLATGFVHNRARMISASFLCKHLLVHYARGERHYAKWLVDGDPASNNLGWQWSAGTGCDAQPYFRVFNPVTQGQRFDPDGNYVRRYVPELRELPTKHIHAPWEASDSELRAAGVALGDTYPHPIVDHADARTRYLLIAQTHLDQRRRTS